MKIRSGFVSNSSSSSFVFVGFPKTAINDSTVNLRTELRKRISAREINKFALEYFITDATYNNFLDGNSSDEFWKALRDRYANELGDYDAPDGYTVHCVYKDGNSELYWGIDVASVSGTGTDEVSIEDIINAKGKIMEDFPTVTPKIILGSDS